MSDNKEALPVVTLGKLMNMHLPCDAESCSITIRIQNPGGLTAHQTVEASGAYFGIDWEARQLVITPRQMLTTLSPEQLEELSASARAGQSWHAYQAHKKHKEREAELRAEVEMFDRVLRSSVPERWKSCASPIGAAQSYIAELEEAVISLGGDLDSLDVARSAASGESAEGGV